MTLNNCLDNNRYITKSRFDEVNCKLSFHLKLCFGLAKLTFEYLEKLVDDVDKVILFIIFNPLRN